MAHNTPSLDSMEEYSPTSNFGIVSTFSSALDNGEDFLNTEPSVPKAEPKKEEPETPKAEEPKTPEVTPKIIQAEDPLEFGDKFLEEEESEESEEEEVSEKSTFKKTTPKEETPAADEDNNFQIIASELFNTGLFTLDEGEEELPPILSGEELMERFTHEKNKQAHKTIYDFLESQHGEEGIEVFEAIFQKGVAPKDYLQKYVEVENVVDLNLEGESNVNNQKKIMRMIYQQQGLDQEDIEAEVEKLENYGDLEATAKRYHKAVIKNKQSELKQLEQEAEAEAKAEHHRIQYHNNAMNQILSNKLKERAFDGIPVTEKVAKDAYHALTQIAYKLPDGEPATTFDAYLYNLNHPDNFEKKVKLYLLTQLMEKDPTLETIKKKGVSEKTDKLFNKLVTQEKKTKHNNPINTPSKGFSDGII